MSEFRPPRRKKERLRAAGVKTILHHLIDRHTDEPYPYLSEHYRAPEQQDSSLKFYEQPEDSVGYTDRPTRIVGFDKNGEFTWMDVAERLNRNDDEL